MKRFLPPTAAPPTVQNGISSYKKLQSFASIRREKECPNCFQDSKIIYDNHSGDELCSRCGLVLESKVISEEQEWRTFSATDSNPNEVDRSRVGGINDAWLDSGGAQGTAMIGGDKKHNRLLQTHEMATAVGGSDRLLKTAFSNLRNIAEYFDLRENVIERCKEMVKELQVAEQLKGRSGDVYMLSIVYIACREEQIRKSLKELVAFNRSITEKELGRAINRLKKIFPPRSHMTSIAALDLIPRICHLLQLSKDVAEVSCHVSKATEPLVSKMHRPNAIAAGSVYLITQICQLGIDVYDVASTARIGASQVLAVYKEMLPFSSQVLPSDFDINSL